MNQNDNNTDHLQGLLNGIAGGVALFSLWGFAIGGVNAASIVGLALAEIGRAHV